MPDLIRKRAFQLLLAGQCISNIGEACRFVSVTLFLVKTTGSGVSAAFGLICAALPGIILSPFAGVIGDLLPEKPLLAAADFIRACIVLSFLGCQDISFIYFLLVILSIVDTICSPARRKFITVIAGKKDVLTANSLLTGASGAAFLIGPLLGGVLVDYFGNELPFILNCISYLISGILILSIKYNRLTDRYKNSGTIGLERIYRELIAGFSYFKKQQQIRKTVSICALLSFGMVSMNMAFYPFAFDILGLTAKGWSLMLSIFYGTNLVAMALTPLISNMRAGRAYPLLYVCMSATGVIWAFYGLTCSLPVVLVLQFLEGTILAVCGIILGTLLQTLADKNFIARISGANDLIGSIGKLAAMLFAFLVLKYLDYRMVFIIDAILLFIFSIFNNLKSLRDQ